METKVKKNPDYSASAVNLTNPSEVALTLVHIKLLQAEIDNLDDVMKSYPEYEQMVDKQQELAKLRKEAEMEIDTYGSYQDTEKGFYALKQRAVTVSYLADRVHEHLPPAMVAAVIVESVDKGTVEALVKAGRITPDQQEAISQKIEVYKYIIR